MAKQEVHAELLLGRRVRALNGRVIGRLEEIRIRQENGRCFIEEFLTGRYALLERISGLIIGRAVLRLLTTKKKYASYRIPWDQLDLDNPEAPRLRCELSALSTIDGS